MSGSDALIKLADARAADPGTGDDSAADPGADGPAAGDDAAAQLLETELQIATWLLLFSAQWSIFSPHEVLLMLLPAE